MPLFPLRRTAQALKEDPFEAAVAFAAALLGVFALGAPQGPSALVSRLLPDYLEHTWGIYLLLGGLTVIVGLVVRKHESRIRLGYRIESVGLSVLGPACLVYAVVVLAGTIIAHDNLIAVSYAVVTNLAFAGACVLARINIRERQQLLKAVQREYR